MAKIGYARVSSKEQHLDRQLAVLKGVGKLFTDKLSGANTNRPELQKMLAYIREGDIVLVTELDRLGRNNQDLTKIMNTIQNKGATLDVLNLPSMTGITDPNLRQLMTNLIIELYKYQCSNGCLEGINRKIKQIERTAYGYGNFDHLIARIKLEEKDAVYKEKSLSCAA